MLWNVAGQQKMFLLFFSAHLDASLVVWFHGQRLLVILLDKPIIFCSKRLPAYPKQSLFRRYFVICSLRKPLILKGVWPADSSCSITGSFFTSLSEGTATLLGRELFTCVFVLKLNKGRVAFRSDFHPPTPCRFVQLPVSSSRKKKKKKEDQS